MSKSEVFEDDVPYDRWDEANVVDAEAYKRWQLLSRDKLLNDGRHQVCSDGTIISLGSLPHVLREQIAHLKDKEREEIMLLKDEYNRKLGRATSEKKKAFGIYRRSPAEVRLHQAVDKLEEFGREIRGLYSRMFSPEEVQKVCVEEFKIACPLDAAVAFRKKHLDTITKGIEHFKRSHEDMRLGVKKGRMEELTWLYGRTKNRYITSDASADREYMLKLLEQIRKESEGDIIKVEGNIDVQVTQMVNIHLRKEVMAHVNLGQIIMGRVSARMRVEPTIILKRLNQSAYARFNGLVTEDIQDAQYEELRYPSGQGYDFDLIKQQYRIHTKEEAEESKAIAQEVQKTHEVASAGGFKALLQKKLADMRGDNLQRGAVLDQALLDAKLKRTDEKLKQQAKDAKKKS